MSWTLKTPVALLIYNRPDKTKCVFDQIAKARPPKLFLISDAPRPDRRDDADKVRLTRSIVEQVDWDCEVLTNYSDVHLGMNSRTVSGLNWVFENVEQTIFLEDDCLPHQTFFRFCSELLEKYREEKRVMMVSGDNFMRQRKVTSYSYFFSHYTGTWGWATWRRAWQYLDLDMSVWLTLRSTSFLEDILGNKTYARYWRHVLDNVAARRIESWDFNWLFTLWTQNGLSISPSTNLISNIGFGADATNLVNLDPITANVPTYEMTFPLEHPPCMVTNVEADEFTSQYVFKCDRWINYIAGVVRQVFPSMTMNRELAARLHAKSIESSEREGK